MLKAISRVRASMPYTSLRYKKIRVSIILLIMLSCGMRGLPSGDTVMATPYGGGSYGSCFYGGSCSISLSTSGTLGISLAATPSGVYSIQKDAVVVETQNPQGYNLALESNSPSSAALSSGGNTLPASSGTIDAPIPLAVNTWGYRIDNQASFGAGPTSAATNATSSSLSFAGLALGGSPQTIYSSNIASAGGGDTINVWYGVRADTTLPAGNYQQTVIYTATAMP